MSWFRKPKTAQVEIDGNRFRIIPEMPQIIDLEAESSNLPAVREPQVPEVKAEPKTGIIPSHSWGG